MSRTSRRCFTHAPQDHLRGQGGIIDGDPLLVRITGLLGHARRGAAPDAKGEWAEWREWIETGASFVRLILRAARITATMRILRETRVYLCTIDRRARKIMTVLLFIWVRT